MFIKVQIVVKGNTQHFQRIPTRNNMAIQTDVKLINTVSRQYYALKLIRVRSGLIIVKPSHCYVWVILQLFLKHIQIFILKAYMVIISIVDQVTVQGQEKQII